MPKIWVAVPPATDPGLVGLERCRKPGSGPNAKRFFTTTPEETEETAAILRLIHNGSLVRVEKPVFGLFEKK